MHAHLMADLCPNLKDLALAAARHVSATGACEFEGRGATQPPDSRNKGMGWMRLGF